MNCTVGLLSRAKVLQLFHMFVLMNRKKKIDFDNEQQYSYCVSARCANY